MSGFRSHYGLIRMYSHAQTPSGTLTGVGNSDITLPTADPTGQAREFKATIRKKAISAIARTANKPAAGIFLIPAFSMTKISTGIAIHANMRFKNLVSQKQNMWHEFLIYNGIVCDEENGP